VSTKPARPPPGLEQFLVTRQAQLPSSRRADGIARVKSNLSGYAENKRASERVQQKGGHHRDRERPEQPSRTACKAAQPADDRLA